ncbi:hypothetical protein JOY44_25625 (plasmid) [Phormidium sp. CLA17]|uniref:hypothetical protein n=1 Tax=Leptolyngbya sp. Cla-17 TaxID=2803751 RepID=UPI0014911E3F|nr:hypothetical protein [Leptolyngbya sp. Cla-17]MBM0744902.1 hypothetical protein [Leptolyngbya sp. Cla-17]
MVFTVSEASAEKIERDISELYRALARILNQDIPEIPEPQPVLPSIEMQAELEEESFIDGEVLPELNVLMGTEQAQLIGREPDLLRGVDPIAIEGNDPPLLQASEAAEVRLQIGNTLIARPLLAIPEALEAALPEKIAALRAAVERPVLPQQAAVVEVVDGEILDVEVNGVQQFHQTEQGVIAANSLYPVLVEQNAVAVANGQRQIQLQQLQDLANYLLEFYAAPSDSGSRMMSLEIDEERNPIYGTSPHLMLGSSDEGVWILKLPDENNPDLQNEEVVIAAKLSGQLKEDLLGQPEFNPFLANQAYGVLQRELGRQVEAHAAVQSRLVDAANVFAQPDAEVTIRTAYYNLQISSDAEDVTEIGCISSENQEVLKPVLTRQTDGSYVSLAEDLEPIAYGLEQQAAAILQVEQFGQWNAQQTMSVEQYYRAMPNQLLEQASEDICGIRMPLASVGAGLDRETLIATIFDHQGAELKERSLVAAQAIADYLDPQAQQDLLKIYSGAVRYELYRPYQGSTELEGICAYVKDTAQPFISIAGVEDGPTLPTQLEGLSNLAADLRQIAVEPQMVLRPIGEVETVTGKELGDLEYLHGAVVAESPVVLVQVDDQGRPIVTAPVVAHVEATEDEVKTDVKDRERDLALPLVEPSSVVWENLTAIADYLECNLDVAIAQESSSGLTASFDANNLLKLQTPEGRMLIVGLASEVQTDFTESDFQAVATLAQKTTLAMAAEVDVDEQFDYEMECE